MEKIKKSIELKIKKLESQKVEINERYEEGFDPSDWSGGNFDDAYDLGVEDGEVFGKLKILEEILELINSLK